MTRFGAVVGWSRHILAGAAADLNKDRRGSAKPYPFTRRGRPPRYTAQTGTQDPFEAVFTNTGTFPAGSRIVVVLYSGARRAFHVDTNRGTLSIATTGSTYGHNAGLNTVSMAATYWNSARTGTRAFTGSQNPIEVFSSDGPRKIFCKVTPPLDANRKLPGVIALPSGL